ncbi:hypothetical protein T12_3310 [Trichinella patagoniensis]|uniref:Uncharacterized protein n=1 Tax=Trichinella patagoniensis TaxID=990121 RepID=A0A0V0YRC3_9BILA|nr:hypothetical protein T12_3310 [Trichinella patagoniensis]
MGVHHFYHFSHWNYSLGEGIVAFMILHQALERRLRRFTFLHRSQVAHCVAFYASLDAVRIFPY